MEITQMAMEMGAGALMVALMEESVKDHFINGLRDPNQKMVKVDGSMSSQVGLAPVMNQEKEHQNAFHHQNEQV